ncbi:MAG: GNAT family N-acetyltransferase [Saprospiraceae bacterium]
MSQPLSAFNIVDYKQAYKQRWKEINEAWVKAGFEMEEIDHQHCSHPEKSILAGGGHILIALAGGEVVGTAALVKDDDETFELIKMAVDERFRGRGIGRALCVAAIERAQILGARLLYLYSNTKAAAAIQLYRKLGFKDVPLDKQDWVRANVRMNMRFK